MRVRRRTDTRGVRVRDEAGQAGAEYVGGLLVVALIVGVLVTAGLGDTVAYATERAVACIVGGGCPAGAEDEGGGSTRVAAVRRAPPEAPPACLLTSHAVTYTSTADFLFNRSVNGSTYLHAVHSDDVTEIRSTEFEGSGTVVMVGGELPIGGGRLRVSAGGSSVSVEEEGHVFLLDTEEAAEYQFWTEKLAQERYMAGPLPDWETQQKIAFLEAIRLGYADRRYTRTGSETEIEIGGAIKVIYGELIVSGASGVAVEEDTRTGATTVTFDIAGETAGELGVMLLGGPVASAESGLAVSLEVRLGELRALRAAGPGRRRVCRGCITSHEAPFRRAVRRCACIRCTTSHDHRKLGSMRRYASSRGSDRRPTSPPYAQRPPRRPRQRRPA